MVLGFLLSGDALVQTSSFSQVFAQHVLCSCASAPVQHWWPVLETLHLCVSSPVRLGLGLEKQTRALCSGIAACALGGSSLEV